ncbi:hypothetical protein N1851_030356 [Merluccius polli]|uniref:HAT C-terminal dimerisation domain-containing protein n=1 Tax=Merluccius polli TaxID=89951 RepID=A0AA47M5P2_MERPO|nr:hypothetical protein N1851_030356 [Merluccius polli]
MLFLFDSMGKTSHPTAKQLGENMIIMMQDKFDSIEKNQTALTHSTLLDPRFKSIDINLWETLDRDASEARMARNATVDATVEVQRYMNDPPLERSEEPLVYWANHKNVYPHLFILAQQFLCTPASSVPSKRVFAKCGEIVLHSSKDVVSGSGSHGEVTSTITCEPPQDRVRPSTPPKTWIQGPAHMERLLARSHVSLLRTRKFHHIFHQEGLGQVCMRPDCYSSLRQVHYSDRGTAPLHISEDFGNKEVLGELQGGVAFNEGCSCVPLRMAFFNPVETLLAIRCLEVFSRGTDDIGPYKQGD